jgi:hypothetical protein
MWYLYSRYQSAPDLGSVDSAKEYLARDGADGGAGEDESFGGAQDEL